MMREFLSISWVISDHSTDLCMQLCSSYSPTKTHGDRPKGRSCYV